MKQVIHFSGLNGLRAIAALAVLFAHTTKDLNLFGLDQFFLGKDIDGNPQSTLLAKFGVSIFFALSGFLITYLLLEEKKRGGINIKNFYIRRILRIWPLYYLYFVLSIITMAIFDFQIDTTAVFFYIFLMANIPFGLGFPIPLVAHYWSLGVEEQFYSFWPWLVKKSKALLRITVFLCIFLIILKTFFRYIDITYYKGVSNWPYEILNPTRFQCMLLGAIGAILFFQKNSLFLKITNNYIAQAISWGVILLVAINKFHVISFLDNEIVSLVTVVLIIGQIQKTKRIVNLDTLFFDFIGKISYGIYVIHPLVIFYASKTIHFAPKTGLSGYLIVYGTIFAATILLAYLSYEYFERRFLDLKTKYTAVGSTDSKKVD